MYLSYSWFLPRLKVSNFSLSFLSLFFFLSFFLFCTCKSNSTSSFNTSVFNCFVLVPITVITYAFSSFKWKSLRDYNRLNGLKVQFENKRESTECICIWFLLTQVCLYKKVDEMKANVLRSQYMRRWGLYYHSSFSHAYLY